jgi:hypothetical protein
MAAAKRNRGAIESLGAAGRRAEPGRNAGTSTSGRSPRSGTGDHRCNLAAPTAEPEHHRELVRGQGAPGSTTLLA